MNAIVETLRRAPRPRAVRRATVAGLTLLVAAVTAASCTRPPVATLSLIHI